MSFPLFLHIDETDLVYSMPIFDLKPTDIVLQLSFDYSGIVHKEKV